MPTYNFRNTKTNEEFEIIMRISELDKYKEDNPHMQQILTATKIISMAGTLHSRTSDGFKDVLNKIKDGSGSNNTIKTK
jgi:predicted nucleic acid-binding Zn ribbon protein